MRTQIEHDLQKHFHQRIRQVMADSVNTAEMADMNPASVGAMMLSIFFHELTMMAHAMDLSKAEFLRMSVVAYEQMALTIKEKAQ